MQFACSSKVWYVCVLLVTDRDGHDVVASAAGDKPSADLPCGSAPNTQHDSEVLFDSDGSQEDIGSQQQWSSQGNSREDVMLMDIADEASSLQVPCLVPESVVPSGGSPQSQADRQSAASNSDVDVLDSNIEVQSSADPRVTVPANSADGGTGTRKPAPGESQPFDFVNEVMRSCSPKVSNKSAAATALSFAVKDELKAAETEKSKPHAT